MRTTHCLVGRGLYRCPCRPRLPYPTPGSLPIHRSRTKWPSTRAEDCRRLRVGDAPVDDAPVDDAPVDDAPVDDAPLPVDPSGIPVDPSGIPVDPSGIPVDASGIARD